MNSLAFLKQQYPLRNSETADFVRRLTGKYKQKSVSPRETIECVSDEEINSLYHRHDNFAPGKRNRAIRWREDRHVKSMDVPDRPQPSTVAPRKLSLDTAMHVQGVKVKS